MSLMAELQQEVEYQKMLILDARKQNDLLKAENAELREFARRAYSFSYNCYHGAFDQEVFFDLRDRMSGLGIEVES